MTKAKEKAPPDGLSAELSTRVKPMPVTLWSPVFETTAPGEDTPINCCVLTISPEEAKECLRRIELVTQLIGKEKLAEEVTFGYDKNDLWWERIYWCMFDWSICCWGGPEDDWGPIPTDKKARANIVPHNVETVYMHVFDAGIRWEANVYGFLSHIETHIMTEELLEQIVDGTVEKGVRM